MLDFESKTRPCQILLSKNEKNATFLAINHSTISYQKETYKGPKKLPPTRITLIRALSPGWASAPYKQNQKNVRTQKLTELVSGPTPAIKFYSFQKVPNNSEKGVRCDDIFFELQPGNVLNYWMDEKRLGEIKDTLDGLTEIPEFTMCIVQIAPKNNDAIAKGYGCTIKSIKPSGYSLHSCLQVNCSCVFRHAIAAYHTKNRTSRPFRPRSSTRPWPS
jgi:hypothetical protein